MWPKPTSDLDGILSKETDHYRRYFRCVALRCGMSCMARLLDSPSCGTLLYIQVVCSVRKIARSSRVRCLRMYRCTPNSECFIMIFVLPLSLSRLVRRWNVNDTKGRKYQGVGVGELVSLTEEEKVEILCQAMPCSLRLLLPAPPPARGLGRPPVRVPYPLP